MKRLMVTLGVLLILSSACTCFAQGNAGAPPPPGPNVSADRLPGGSSGGTMGGRSTMPGMGMGGGMMGGMHGMMGTMPGMDMGAGMQMWPMVTHRLRLTDDQQRRIMLICLEYCKTQASANGQIQANKIGIAQIMLSDRPEKGKVDAAVREINKLQGEQMMAGVNAMFAAKDVLTPEQWKTLQSMAPSLMARMHSGQMGGMSGGMGAGMTGMSGGMGRGMSGGMGQGMRGKKDSGMGKEKGMSRGEDGAGMLPMDDEDETSDAQ